MQTECEIVDKYNFLQLISRWKHFYPAGRGLSEDDSAPIHRTQGFTESFQK